MIILILFAILLVSFILFKVISKRIAGRKRRKAEEQARREEKWREEVEPDPTEEDIIAFEKIKSVANIAKEHPEDAAQLIRRLMQEDPIPENPSTHKEAILQESKELMLANNLIKTVGSGKARELLEKTLGSQKAVDLINLLTRTVQG